jgi:PiT family inorganic phosphate transporter
MELATILVIFILISILISFAIGANDETMATIHGSKTLTMKEILILATIFAILGAFLLGGAVSQTVGKDLLAIEVSDSIVMTILISTAIWLIISSLFGLPISTTHATIGAIIGVGLFLGDAVSWLPILELSLWWLLSPIIGFVATYFTYKLIHKTIINKLSGFKSFETTEKYFSYILLGVICWTAFSRAGNDCSNAVGIVVGIGEINIDLLLLITGLSLALGIVILNITELHPSTAFASEIPLSIILFIGTYLGIPLSGSHMLVASLVGLAKARKAPTKKGLWKIILIWLITFPAAAILSICLYLPINSFF